MKMELEAETEIGYKNFELDVQAELLTFPRAKILPKPDTWFQDQLQHSELCIRIKLICRDMRHVYFLFLQLST